MENNAYSMPAKRPLSIDGVRAGSTTVTPAGRRIQVGPAVPVHPPERRTFAKPRTVPKEHKLLQSLQLPALLVVGTVGGFFADNLAIGLALLAAYALSALLVRIPSRITFTLALLLLSAISVLFLFKPNMHLIGNFATYAFVLLMIGVITLGREARLPKRTRRKYRR